MKTCKKILIAHHDETMRRRLVMLLAAAGFDVRPFDSPGSALAGASDEWFDLALVDGHFTSLENADLSAGLRGIQPTLQVLLMVDKLDLSAGGPGVREGVAEVVAVAGDPMPVLRQALAFFRLGDSGETPGLGAEELGRLESTLGVGDASAPALTGSPDLETALLQLIGEKRILLARAARLEEEKAGLEVELRTLVAQGTDVQRLQGEMETIRQERELAAVAQLAIDEKARALSELRANVASERSALECERQRIAQEAPARSATDAELSQVRAELADWRRRLEEEDDRLASDAARVRQESLQLARERRRWHEDQDMIRAQETNLRSYEGRLREMQAMLETERVKWTGGAGAPQRAPDEAGERALQKAWIKVQRTGELLEAERKNFLDDRLHLREQEKMIKQKEDQFRDRELRLKMKEKAIEQMQAAEPPAPSKAAQIAKSPVAALSRLLRA
jgi:CheY-like chemotaxis protein